MSNAANSGSKRIYLDHAAATPLSDAARSAMHAVADIFGNPSSLHEEGRAAHAVLAASRSTVAGILGAAPSEVVFTGSGSEADALAIRGTAHAYRHAGSHIVVSAIEHKAVLKAAESLEKEGFSVTYLPVDAEGSVSPEALAASLREDTVLVSIMYANNEIGTVEPIRKLADAVRKHRGARTTPLFHTDACQAPGSLSIRPEELGVDLMTLNSAKIYGPKGIGALYIRNGVRLEPVVGGEQEQGLRGGTENIGLIAGFAAAFEEAESKRAEEAPRLAALRDLLIAEIVRLVPEATVNGSKRARLPNNVHVSLPSIEGESVLLKLDAEGIACSTGSACSALDLVPSHVLCAIGQDPEIMHGSVRMTLGRSTTEADVRFAAEALARAFASLRKISTMTVPQKTRV